MPRVHIGTQSAQATDVPLVFATSDLKFHEIFWREIFQEIFREIF